MKKTLTAAALSSVLVLGLASSAFAVHATQTAETPTVAKGDTKVSLDGNVRVRGYYNKSVATQDTPGSTGYDTKVQLGTKAQVSDQATGYVKLETGTGTSDVEAWGSGSAAGLNTGGYKMDGVTLVEAWLNYQPSSWGVKAGHMPLALGNKVFFDHTGSGDDALVFYVNPNDATHIAALTIKFDEQSTGDNSDDLDGYVGLITHKLSDTVNLGGNWTYLRGGANDGAELASGMSMSNVGLNADGKIGAISYLADVEFQFGDLADNGTTTTDASGWAMKLGANYDLGGGKVGLLFGYGSGDDNTDNDYEQFVNFLTDTTYDTILGGYISAMPGTGGPLGNTKNTGLSNLTLFQLNGSAKTVCPMTGKDLSLNASLSYMQLSEDMINGTNADLTNHMADTVGTEVDLVASWALTAGLNYRVEAAYMFVGDAYETVTAGSTSDPDNVMFLRHSLDLKF